MTYVEAALISAAVLGATLPFVWARKWSGLKLVLFAVGILVATCGAALTVSTLELRGPIVAERDVTNRPRALTSDGYTSSSTCQACHPREYATWHGSYHRSMTQVATPATVLGNFEMQPAASTWEQNWTGTRKEDEFWASIQEKGNSESVKRRIVMTTGSHHMQIYWVETGSDRRVQMAPFVWFIEEQRWITRDSAFLQSPLHHQRLVPGKWNASCMLCHTTHAQPLLMGRPPEEIDTRVAEFGIACEACHGPSAEHARAQRNPLRRYEHHLSGRDDTSVVQPERLDAARASQVCGQCHSVFYPQRDFAEFDDGKDYRPGDDLAQTQHIVRGFDDDHPLVQRAVQERPDWHERHFWPDGMVRVSGREYNGLIASPCYVHGNEAAGILTCLSCHQMHQSPNDTRTMHEWANDQLKPETKTNAACISCHTQYETPGKASAHSHHKEGSSGSVCYNCHMPHTTYGLLTAMRSHEIDSPNVATTVETGRPNACNLCHLDKTLAWTRDYLTQWYEIPGPQLDPDWEQIAASLLWLIKGDAGQRALAAWNMGWDQALETSGTGWMVPFLAMLLEDEYEAVRFIAYRSLRRQPGYSDLVLDWLAPSEIRSTILAAVADWKGRRLGRGAPDNVLINPDGSLRTQEIKRLGLQRDTRAMDLAE